MTYHLSQLVAVRLPNGMTHLGRVRSHEPGENLGPRLGGPIKGTAYTVELEGVDGQGRRDVVVGDERVSAIHEDGG